MLNLLKFYVLLLAMIRRLLDCLSFFFNTRKNYIVPVAVRVLRVGKALFSQFLQQIIIFRSKRIERIHARAILPTANRRRKRRRINFIIKCPPVANFLTLLLL